MKTLLLLSEKDNVLTCTAAVKKGAEMDVSGGRITALDDIPVYHKIAGTFIKAGEIIYKYGEAIGVATRDIRPGEHAHIHNVRSARGGKEGA